MEALLRNSIVATNYRIDGELGRGGFGVTYRATNLNTGEAVAIKRLNLRDLDDWKGVELFEREAKVLARLDHPSIPKYVAFLPILADRAGLLVQGLAPGRSLQSEIEDGRLFTEVEVENIARQVLEILHYLATQSPAVVHRDVKPANLIIDDAAVVRLVDFGAVTSAAAKATSLGSTVAGTFGYMAPEQVQGAIEPRSDQYALGMTMIALLTGTSPADIPRRRLKPRFEEVVDVSASLAGFIDRLIEPVPDDRFKRVKAALIALDDIIICRTTSGPTADIGTLIAARELKSRQAHLQSKASENRRREKAIVKVKNVADRVVVRGTDGAVEIEIAPESLKAFVWKQTGGVLAFIWINPGAFVGLGIVFLLRYFFGLSFARAMLGATLIWTTFLMAGNVLLAKLRQSRTALRLTSTGEFALFQGRKKKPQVFGRIEELSVTVDKPNDARLGDAHFGDGHERVIVRNLTPRDLAALRNALSIRD